ncbi:inositol monophosphatase family protein [Thermosulfuriphilus sp.]
MKLLQKVALEAGETIRNLYERPHQVTHKGEIDLVTEADLRSEEIIVKGLKGHLPHIPILAEEKVKEEPGEEYLLVDPLDGTTNFAHGFPWFAVSLAFMRAGSPEIGVIYHPMMDELFWAQRGQGAYLNGRRIKVSRIKELSGALLATGFPYDVHQRPEVVIGAFSAFIIKAQGIRRAGAAALDLAYVACGRFDGFWEIKLKPWDTAAGILLVEEAGGRVSDFRGHSYSPYCRTIVASNSLIHHQMIDITRNFIPDEP